MSVTAEASRGRRIPIACAAAFVAGAFPVAVFAVKSDDPENILSTLLFLVAVVVVVVVSRLMSPARPPAALLVAISGVLGLLATSWAPVYLPERFPHNDLGGLARMAATMFSPLAVLVLWLLILAGRRGSGSHDQEAAV